MQRKFPTILNQFFADRHGSIAIIFALVLIPVLGLVGAGVDFTRAHGIKNKL